MTTRVLLAWTLAAGFIALAADYHPLDIKPGQWESIFTIDMNAPPPISPELLAKLPPEQRAKLEQKTSPLNSRSINNKSCINKDKLDKPMILQKEDKACSYSLITSTATTQEIHVECSTDKMKSKGTIRVQALNSENMKGTSQMTMTMGDQTREINSSFSAKWIGATCGGNN